MSLAERSHSLEVLPDGSVVRADLRDARYARIDDPVKVRDKHDRRLECERDLGRIRYSTALLRLGGVSQVTTPVPEIVNRHNRLTHSLKVAGLAREIASDLLRRAASQVDEDDSGSLSDCIEFLGGLDSSACEVGGLAHDIGHAPFAHTSQDLLDAWLLASGDSCGFEGNAQSIRVLTRLEPRNPRSTGLGLTSLGLAAAMKYPWLREVDAKTRRDKFSAYREDASSLDFAQSALPVELRGRGLRSLEAAIVDLADDIAYGIHDVQDFVEAGLLDMQRIIDEVAGVARRLRDETYANRLLSGVHDGGFETVTARICNDPRFDLSEFSIALLNIKQWMSEELVAGQGSGGGTLGIGVVRRAFSNLIASVLRDVTIDCSPEVEGAWVSPGVQGWHRIQVLKLIGRYYVVESARVSFQESAHRAALARVLDGMLDWSLTGRRHSLPEPLVSYAGKGIIEAREDSPGLRRAIADYVCYLSDRQCLDLAAAFDGVKSPIV